MADPYRCPELSFHGFLQYLTLTLGSENKNYVFSLPPGLVMLFHLLSIFLSAFVIHFNKSSTSICSFMSPLDCQEREISSFVHHWKMRRIQILLLPWTPKNQNC